MPYPCEKPEFYCERYSRYLLITDQSLLYKIINAKDSRAETL